MATTVIASVHECKNVTPFESVWESSQHNAWSGYSYAMIAIGIIFLVFTLPLKRLWQSIALGITIVAAFTAAAYYAAWLESEAKWTIRITWAAANPNLLTDQDKFVMADRMAINRPFGPILATWGAFLTLGCAGTTICILKALTMRTRSVNDLHHPFSLDNAHRSLAGSANHRMNPSPQESQALQ